MLWFEFNQCSELIFYHLLSLNNQFLQKKLLSSKILNNTILVNTVYDNFEKKSQLNYTHKVRGRLYMTSSNFGHFFSPCPHRYAVFSVSLTPSPSKCETFFIDDSQGDTIFESMFQQLRSFCQLWPINIFYSRLRSLLL